MVRRHPGFRLDRNTALLIGAGSSTCGAAAMMAAEPVMRGRVEQVTVAVSTVVVFGALAMFLYPVLYHFSQRYTTLSMSPDAYGIFAGSTIHEVAQVVAAGHAIRDELLIAPSAWLTRSWDASDAASRGAVRNQPLQEPGRIATPWFAFSFVVMAGMNSLAWLALAGGQRGDRHRHHAARDGDGGAGSDHPHLAIRNAGVRPLASRRCCSRGWWGKFTANPAGAAIVEAVGALRWTFDGQEPLKRSFDGYPRTTAFGRNQTSANGCFRVTLPSDRQESGAAQSAPYEGRDRSSDTTHPYRPVCSGASTCATFSTARRSSNGRALRLVLR